MPEIPDIPLPGPGRESLRRAVGRVPPGRWGVAVSGGADSVACFCLLQRRAALNGDLSLVVVHLDHELRGEESMTDARFVADLARSAGVPLVLRRRSELPALQGPANLPARLRRLRLQVYREAVEAHGLAGIILGHHADDLAETLLLRLLRGSPHSGTLGLAPLRVEQVVSAVRLLRPMLGVRSARLRGLLRRMGQPWREDLSNRMDVSKRNRVRRLLADRPDVVERLIGLAGATARAEAALERATPHLDPAPAITALVQMPPVLRRRAFRRWLAEHGVPDPGPRLVELAEGLLDAAGPAVLDLSPDLRLRRRRGRLDVERRGSGDQSGA